MLSASLLTVALLVNIYHRIGYRVLICFVVIMSTAIHTHFFDNEVSFTYYGTAAISNLFVILFLSLVSRSPLATSIQVISLFGIVANFVGYGLYEAYLPPIIYNVIMSIIMIAEGLRLLIRTRNDRFHDVCENDRLHHGLSVNDNFSNSTDTRRSQ